MYKDLQEQVKNLLSAAGVNVLPDMTGPVDGKLEAVTRKLMKSDITKEGVMNMISGDFITLRDFAMYSIEDGGDDWVKLRGHFHYQAGLK